MSRSSRLALVLALVLGSIALAAAEPITIGERLELPSKLLSETRSVLVSTPPGYERTQESYPVLYMTDGIGHLVHTRGTVDFLARQGMMPQVIIVAIVNTDRTRDLTPTRADTVLRNGTIRKNPTSGGADTFLDFIEKELFPFVEKRYRTVPYRIFAGHSYGGLLALHAAFTRPDLFGSVISVSPSLRWDDALPVRQASTFLEGRKTFNGGLFVTMANELRDDPSPNLLDKLESHLEGVGAKGFEWAVMRMPDENHGSVVLRSHYWGFKHLFASWQMPRDPNTGRVSGGLSGIKAHYTALSKRVGFSMTPPEGVVNILGYQELGRGGAEEAIAIFRYNVELYPDSANVYDSLGEALERQGALAEAAKAYGKAAENAKKNGDDRLGIFSANYERVKGKLAPKPAE